jgi:hypothetical protein
VYRCNEEENRKTDITHKGRSSGVAGVQELQNRERCVLDIRGPGAFKQSVSACGRWSA